MRKAPRCPDQDALTLATSLQADQGNELGPALPTPTPDNVLDVLRRRFPGWRFRLDTPDDIRTTGQTLARLDWQKELDGSLRTAIDGFLKVNAEVASTMYGSSVDELSVNWGRKAVRLREHIGPSVVYMDEAPPQGSDPQTAIAITEQL